MAASPVPETHYARTPDGVSLAYHTVGDGAVDLLWLHAFLGGLEVLWESDVMRSVTETLASFSRVIRHDMRATGLSGRATALPDLETQVRDIAVVLDAVGSRSTVILGSGPGAHVAALFAATFPERTRAAVLWDLFAWTGQAFSDTDMELVQRSWGTESAAAASMARVAPSMIVDRGFLRWLAKVHRHFVPPDTAAELMQRAIETDVRPILPMIRVPTLVLARHWPGYEHDRDVAEEIEGARFVLLDGEDRATFAGDTTAFADAIRSFVGGEIAPVSTGTQLRAVLFTDIVGSTEHLADAGDKAWRDLIYTMVRVSLGKRGAMLTVRRHWSTRTTTRVAARCRNGSRETSDVPWVARPSGRSGGDDRTRTDDPLLAKQVLYQLSYVPAADTRSAHD